MEAFSTRTTLASLERILNTMQSALKARAVLFLRRDGQVIAREGELAEQKVPHMAALISAMAAASESVAELAGKSKDDPRLSLEFPASGLYAVAVGKEHWVAVLFEGVLNPGQLRMRTRQFGEEIEKLHFKDSFIIEDKVTPVQGAKATLFENITDEEIDGLFRRPS